MNKFLSFYDILLERLKGKKVKLRSYKNGMDYHNFTHKNTKYSKDGIWLSDEIEYWSNDLEYVEWVGTVENILQNDNSHVDIIFDKNLEHSVSEEGYTDDCFNFHMSDYIEIIEEDESSFVESDNSHSIIIEENTKTSNQLFGIIEKMIDNEMNIISDTYRLNWIEKQFENANKSSEIFSGYDVNTINIRQFIDNHLKNK